MFGQSSNRLLSPISLLLMVAFFAVHLTSALASNVHDMSLDLDNFARMQLLSETENPLSDDKEYRQCYSSHQNETMNCMDKAKKEKFHEITDDKDHHCQSLFAIAQCGPETICHNCKDKYEDYYKSIKAELDKEGEKCKQWDKLRPNIPTSCSDGHNGTNDHSPDPEGKAGPISNTAIIIIVVVSLAVVIIGGVIAWCMCCSGDRGGGGRAGRAKSTKSKRGKSGKSLKAKSTKSRKSPKSGKSLKARSKKSKSAKSLKAKSTKSKGAKSTKGK